VALAVVQLEGSVPQHLVVVVVEDQAHKPQ
jgi:hypothetical protein